MNQYSFDSKQVNVTPLFTFYTSSESPWEKYNVGHPLDGYQNNDRFSFHTEEEYEPFIMLTALEPIDISLMKIFLRTGYENKMLPLLISVSENKVAWDEIEVTECNENDSSIEVDLNASNIRFIKIHKKGYSCLYLSSINLFSEHSYINAHKYRLMDPNKGRCVLSYTPFYGLGGQLAVLATSLGYLQTSVYNDIFWHWREYQSGLVDFPLELPKNSTTEMLLENSLSSTILANFKEDNLRQRSSKSVTTWLPPNSNSNQNRPVICISRDQIQQFQEKGEDAYECMKRLYQKIKPSKAVLKSIQDIEKEFNITPSTYRNALGLQVRHGNGECYNSGVTWGVKPPTVKNLIKAVDEAIAGANLEIKTIIIASDSFAVRDVLEQHFGKKYKILFISTEIQFIGGGSNPSPAVFDSNINRRNIDMQLDDKRSFSELLILSKCAAICGGKSFFFNAIIGFSQCDSARIFRINNLDRYINLPETFKLLQQENVEEHKEIIETIYEGFKANNVSIDGIFIDVANLPSIISLSFFEYKIMECSVEKFDRKLIDAHISSTLKELRFY